jgi:TRAP transporter TAXI family solute receptor
MKKFINTSLIALAVILGITCTAKGSQPAASGGQARPAAKVYSLASASLGGTYYIVGAGVAEAITQKIPYLTVNGVIAQGSTGNPLMLDGKEVELAMTNYYSGFNAINGNKPYDHKIPLRGICPLQYSILQFLVFGNRNDINTLADLKGKKVSIGPAGGGGALLFNELLPYWGLSPNDINVSYLSYAEGTDALKDGKIDCNVPHGAPPLEAVSSIAAFDNVKLLNLETGRMNQVLQKYPYYDIAIVPAGTYKGIDRDVQSAGIQDILTVREDANEEEVYQITKAIYDSLDSLRRVHPSIANLKFDGYKDSIVPLHPGARRLYQEKNIPVD